MVLNQNIAMGATGELERMTLNVPECQKMLGVSRSTTYTLINGALKNGGEPFKVFKVGKSIRVARKSFYEYLAKNGC